MMPITFTLPTAYAAGPFPLPLGEGKQAVNYLYVKDCNRPIADVRRSAHIAPRWII